MESKLTLKLDTEAISRAKRYISHHRGYSLSRMVENYFNTLTEQSNEKDFPAMPPIVSGLAGIAKKGKIKDVKGEYTDYLIGKYQ